MQKPVRIQVIGIGVAGALARKHANAAPGARSLAGGLDDLFVDSERGGHHRFEVEVGIVAAGGEGLAEAALQQPLGDAEFFKEKTLVAGLKGSGGSGHRISSLLATVFPVSI